MAMASMLSLTPTAAFNHTRNPRTRTVRCSSSLLSKNLPSDPSPVVETVTCYGPSTIANFGPGIGVVGYAIQGLGDTVTVSVDAAVEPGTLTISSISGPPPASKLSRNPLWNCAGIAGMAVMRMLGVRSVGLSLSLVKGVPISSGLGSSVASAAAAANAVNQIFGNPLNITDLVLASLESEKKFSVYNAGGLGTCLVGGFLLIRSNDPLKMTTLHFPVNRDLFFVLVTPEFEAPSKKKRELLPSKIMGKYADRQSATMVAGLLYGSVRHFGLEMSADVLVEPTRVLQIPGMGAVKKAAFEAGALGCTICGSGPTVVAVTDNVKMGTGIAERMVEAFLVNGGLKATAMVMI